MPTAHHGEVALEAATVPVKKALLSGYRPSVARRRTVPARRAEVYPAPTRCKLTARRAAHRASPENGMKGLDIRKFFDPRYTPEGGTVPIYPPALAESPLNLHTHGLHVSPRGNWTMC